MHAHAVYMKSFKKEKFHYFCNFMTTLKILPQNTGIHCVYFQGHAILTVKAFTHNVLSSKIAKLFSLKTFHAYGSISNRPYVDTYTYAACNDALCIKLVYEARAINNILLIYSCTLVYMCPYAAS